MLLLHRTAVALLAMIACMAVGGRADGSIVANFSGREAADCHLGGAMTDGASGGRATSQPAAERGVFSPSLPISHGGCQGTGTIVTGGTGPSAVLAGEVQLPESTFSVLWVFEKQVVVQLVADTLLRPPRFDCHA
jgi:hypothetical protein